MKTYSLYDAKSGLLAGRTFSTDVADPDAHAMVLAANTPTGHATVEGQFDHLSQRVDLDLLARDDDAAATAWMADKDHRALQRAAGADPGEDPPAPLRAVATAAHVIDYQPPAPSSDHEWNAETKRWQLTAAVQAAQQVRQAALAQIAALEAGQPRAVREALLGSPGGLERLQDIDDQVAALRPRLAP